MKANRISGLKAWAEGARRNHRGNVMILVAAVTLGIVVAVILFALDYNQFLGASHQHLTAVESAGLAAAQDLSRIVVRDQNYGYISLTDYPPVGAKTLAADGRPLPVTGINTIIGTARVDMLIANNIGNAQMVKMAERDYENAQAAARLLTDCLKSALAQDEAAASDNVTDIAGDNNRDARQGPWTDMDGRMINPYADAKRVYMANLTTMSNGGKPVVNAFRCTLGFLESGGSTLTKVPRPDNLAQCSSNQRQGDYYKAFINIPANGHDFYFAGLSAQPALIDARQFRADDGSRVCSAVRVEAEHSFEKAESTTQQVFKTIACAEPSGTPDTTPPGVMTIAFPDGLTPGITLVRDLLTNDDLKSNLGSVAESNGGDWPFDGPSSLLGGKPIITSGGDNNSPSASELFGGGFYDWIRTGHTRPNIASVSAFLGLNIRNVLTADANTGVRNPVKSDWMQSATAAATPSGEAEMIYTGIMENVPTDRWNTLLTKSADALKVYDAICNYVPISANLPDNAAEVKVDQTGRILSTSGEPVDTQTMSQFWQAVHNTQSAAYQALAVAEQGLLANLGNQNLINAKKNAEAAIDATAELIKHQSDYTADGFQKNGDGTFSVGGSKFTPHPAAATTNAVAGMLAGSYTSGAPSNKSWTVAPNDFDVYDAAKIDPDASKAPSRVVKSHLLMAEFDKDGNVVTTAMGSSPFCGLPVSDGQQLGIVYDAITTPGNLIWSAVYRDQCHRWGYGKHQGQPLSGTPVDWCERGTFGFNIGSANSKGKGSDYTGLVVVNTGAPPGTTGAGGSKFKSSKSGKNNANVPLSSGTGPRSSKPGIGDLTKDSVGFPWGFKFGASHPGAEWKVGDVKYEFPGGADELGVGNGASWGVARKKLNNGDVPGMDITTYPSGTPVNPYGEFATFAPKAGGNLPVQPRANYYCGGMAFEYQLRGPVVDLNALLGTTNGLALKPGSGKAVVDGITVPVVGLGSGLDVVQGSSDKGVVGLNEDSFTPPIPKVKSSI